MLLSTLSTFLQHALLAPSASASQSHLTWYFTSAFRSTTSFDSFVAALAPREQSNNDNDVVFDRFDQVHGSMGCDLDWLEVDDLGVAAASSLENYALNVRGFTLTYILAHYHRHTDTISSPSPRPYCHIPR
jgi:hypothetical protein